MMYTCTTSSMHIILAHDDLMYVCMPAMKGIGLKLFGTNCSRRSQEIGKGVQ